MLSVSYSNCKNEIINFIKPDVIITDASDIFSYKWNYETIYNNIIHLRKNIFSTKLSIATSVENANRIYRITEKDARMEEYGTLYCNGWYLNCWCTGCSTKQYYKNSDYVEIQLEFTTDNENWKRDTKFVYREGKEVREGVNYPYGYPYDFASDAMLFELNNVSFMECDFRIKIYGYAPNPKIIIGIQEYEVDTLVDVNEYMVIDSMNRKVVRTTKRGDIVNEYPNINMNSYVFQKIPSGNSKVSTNGDFAFDIEIIEERSEPEWI